MSLKITTFAAVNGAMGAVCLGWRVFSGIRYFLIKG